MIGRIRQIANRKSSIGYSDGFTLIELLVVISIIALLMAVLLPTLGRVRKQARAVACQAKLRQWGLVSSMYMDDHNDKFSTKGPPTTSWWAWSHGYRADCNDLLLCPMAARYEPGQGGKEMSGDWGDGSKYSAWKATGWSPLLPSRGKAFFYGSYGVNTMIIHTYSEKPFAIKTPRPPARFRMPLLLDCAMWQSYGAESAEPPAYDGDVEGDRLMKVYCIDRHEGMVNGLFMDWSVRRVGLKELWALKWHGKYDTAGPWTRAGGVQPEDWPAWMRKFKDY